MDPVVNPPCRVLPARRSDLAAVSAIAQACFTVPWPLQELEKELTRAHATLRVVWPTEADAPLAGFMSYWHVDTEVQIMNVAVAPAQQQRGFGSALVSDALALASRQGATSAVLEVRRSNLAALRLYERHGFVRVGVRARYYSDNQEDAFVMCRDLPCR